MKNDFKETYGNFALIRNVTAFARGDFQNVVPLHDKPPTVSPVQGGQFSWMNAVANKLLGLPPGEPPAHYQAGSVSVFSSPRKILP